MSTREPTAQLPGHVPNPFIPSDTAHEFKLARWLVYFASGEKWYQVGEFVATDASSAIERAVAVFGEASAYRAEEIPWDTAPLWKPNSLPTRSGISRRE